RRHDARVRPRVDRRGRRLGRLRPRAAHRPHLGHIDIRPDFSLVELPAGLPQDRIDKLASTVINGRPIDIRPDRGGPRAADRGAAPERRGRKPRD
ncbi:DbpA RNA binding domain-containing protein, partial [Clavibacter michiganensis]|uniref:DbpA RNA binding domain-containing protein n=1 Tax=Clavibacter michiganensis TaxID=28447 RepID=UPI00292D42D7